MEHRGGRVRRIAFVALRAIGGVGGALSFLAWTYLSPLLAQYIIGRLAGIQLVVSQDYFTLAPFLPLFAMALGAASPLTSDSPLSPFLRLLGRLFNILSFHPSAQLANRRCWGTEPAHGWGDR